MTRTILNVGISSSTPCGVRDYAMTLGDALRDRGLLTADVWTDVEPRRPLSGIANWLSAVDATALANDVAVLILHYSVFGYSWKGIPVANHRISSRLRDLNIPILTVLHEFAFPWGRRGVRGSLQAITQRAALYPLVCVSSELVVTTPERADWLKRHPWLPKRETTFIPVFSNIPLASRPQAQTSPKVIIFGYAANANQCRRITEAVASAAELVNGLQLLLVGGSGADDVVSRLWTNAARDAGCQISFTGPLDPDQLSSTLRSASVAIFPDYAGPTARKGTLAALLSHGCPTIAFNGPQTWDDLVQASAVLLLPADSNDLGNTIVRLLHDTEARTDLGQQARSYYESRMAIGCAVDTLLQIFARIPITRLRSTPSPPAKPRHA